MNDTPEYREQYEIERKRLLGILVMLEDKRRRDFIDSERYADQVALHVIADAIDTLIDARI